MNRRPFPTAGPFLLAFAALLLTADAAFAQPGRGMRGGPPSRGGEESADRGDRGGRFSRGDRFDRGGPPDRGDRGPRDDRGGESRGDRGGDRGAQRGGDRGGRGGGEEVSRERRIFDWVWSRADRNNDGRLTPDEVGDDRMKRFMQDRGLDPEKTYSRDEWNRGAEAFERERARGREEEGNDDERRSGDSRGGESRERSERSAGPSFVRGGARDSRGRPVRVTRDLPEAFGEFDTDEDGQIGLYEWRLWNRALIAEFLTLDRDGDGYLTPRELAEADARDYARGDAAALPPERLSPGPMRPTASVVRSDAVGVPVASAPAAVEEPAELDPRDRAAAERYFKLLDRDRSGRVSLPEWDRSERLKPKFEAAGADLASELDLETFVAYYAKTLE
ncbi:hypothetical protein [Alienimonas sp. DA493]|uniref:hypothetical protein n=1 Tax=Alienimonas sp. DA493 TaxID=3373605 RepID=UPI003754BA1F